MIRTANSRLRAAFIGPCVGIGGGDALMTSLIKNTYNIDWVGAAVPVDINMNMASWTAKGWDSRCPLHVCCVQNQFDGTENHATIKDAIYTACKDANIIISWCYKDLKEYTYNLDIPIIEYAQNSDEYAESIVKSNKSIISYKAACSHAAAKIFNSNGTADGDVTVIYNGIDPNRVSPRKGRQIQRQIWGLPDEAKVVLFMGRMVDEKHPLDVIKAILELPEEYVAIFVGRGYGQEELFRVAQTMIPGRCAFVDPQYHVGDVLAAADCFVLPSDFEGHPLALMEAMLSGLPTVYTDLEVMKELHEKHGEIGVMLPKGEDLCGAIREAVEGENHRIRLARTVVWENYTISRIASQWEEYLHVCLNDWWRHRYLTDIHPVQKRKPITEAH